MIDWEKKAIAHNTKKTVSGSYTRLILNEDPQIRHRHYMPEIYILNA